MPANQRLVFASLIFALIHSGSALAKPPNVVLILADDLGYSDTAPYGSEISTPAISALAEQGIRFSNYHTAASCAPTRGMLLTGVDSHRNGVPNIPESIPPAQEAYPNYAGILGHDVVTIATRMRDAGYHTYMAGKWHLGMAPASLPSRRGFERTVAMADSGADNWEQKPYLPIYKKANWFADGEETTLPEDFYSSKFLIDKTIGFISENLADQKPFFAYVPFQAVHIPVQAPQQFIDHYMGHYDEGWSVLRERRHQAATRLGLIPAGATMMTPSTTLDWNTLTAEEKRYASKKMAVYAGMIEAMDHHIGRLLAYLKEAGEYENTLFIFASDNGSASSDLLNRPGAWIFKLWLRSSDYHTGYETMGLRGSFMNIGPSFASAAASPLAYYKFFAREGGMRVPLIVAGPGVEDKGTVSDAFVYVTDLAPTLLELTGATSPPGRYDGREVEPITGKSLLPLLAGQVEQVYAPDEPIGYELAGNAALFKGQHKIVKDRGPIGDGAWHLFDIASDPGETRDLREEMPDLFAVMMRDYEAYVARNGVQPVPEGYDQRQALLWYGLRNRVAIGPSLAAVAGILLLGVVGWRLVAMRRIARRD